MSEVTPSVPSVTRSTTRPPTKPSPAPGTDPRRSPRTRATTRAGSFVSLRRDEDDDCLERSEVDVRIHLHQLPEVRVGLSEAGHTTDRDALRIERAQRP